MKAFSPVKIEARKELDMRSGDTVRVSQKIQEKGKTRLQIFEGMILSRKHGTEPGATFTVRRTTGGFGVEKIFPLYSPMIDKIEVTRRSKTRRSKLYHVREQALKQVKKRLKMMFVDISMDEKEKAPEVEAPVENTEVIEEEVTTEAPVENVVEATEESTPEEKTEEAK